MRRFCLYVEMWPCVLSCSHRLHDLPSLWRPLTCVLMDLIVHTLCKSIAVKLHEERELVKGRKDAKSIRVDGGEKNAVER